MDEPQEDDDHGRRILEIGPQARADSVINKAADDLAAQYNIDRAAAFDAAQALYHIGWQDALLFQGPPQSYWPDGSPLWTIQRERRPFSPN